MVIIGKLSGTLPREEWRKRGSLIWLDKHHKVKGVQLESRESLTGWVWARITWRALKSF